MSIPVRYDDTKAAHLRREKVTTIIADRTPFPSGSTWAYRPTMQVHTQAPRWKFFHRMIAVEIELEPIAFSPSVRAIDTMGCTTMMGGMIVYLAIHPNGQLMRKVTPTPRTEEGRLIDAWMPVVDFAELSTEDTERMEMAAHGDDSLIEQAYHDACAEIERGFGYDV